MNKNSRPTWHSTFNLTELQSECVVALLAADRLGFHGATVEKLASIGIHHTVFGCMRPLVRKGLVASAGFSDERYPRRVWRATDRARRLFGFLRIAPAPEHVETLEGRAAWAREQMAERERRERCKGAA